MPDPSDGAARRRHTTSVCSHQETAQAGSSLPVNATWLRGLAAALGLRPTKALGQNFVHDAEVLRGIVRHAGVRPGNTVLEVGPGLGSLTLALLAAGARVVAVEIDPVLARALPATVADRMPEASGSLSVVHADALGVTGPKSLGLSQGADLPTLLVANLPYNVAVPVLLTLLEALPCLESATVMVQAEVADRLAAAPGSRTYGIPSAKVAWYASARRTLTIDRTVFWPVPHVDSALVELTRHAPPATRAPREAVFAVIDAAFSQRRKTLRQALAALAGSPQQAEQAARQAGVDPRARGETLDVAAFAALAEALGAQARPQHSGGRAGSPTTGAAACAPGAGTCAAPGAGTPGSPAASPRAPKERP